MKAKEMFEELGYKYYRCDRYIEYSKVDREEITILFKRNHTVKLFTINSITMELNRAIQQQLYELGWLEQEQKEDVED